MQIWSSLLAVVQMVAAIAMIGLVLVQHGKGADMGASFGSGSSGSLFGATGSANFLSRSTAVCATVFFPGDTGLGVYVQQRERFTPPGGCGECVGSWGCIRACGSFCRAADPFS